MALETLAARFGIEVRTADGRTWCSRGGVEVVFAREFEVDTVAHRHTAWSAMLGTRLGIDRRIASYDLSEERAKADGARNVYEVPPTYGERYQQLFPIAVLDVAERVCGEAFVRVGWFDAPDHQIALVRELPRHFHVLAQRDLAELPYDRENMIRYAKLALFYEAYNFRPQRVEKRAWGQLKWFVTRDGQAASRATLLPDFDYDAARASGCFAILDRDRFVIAHPTDDPAAAREALAEVIEFEMPDAPLPFSRRLWLMTDAEVACGPTIRDGGDLDASNLSGAIESVLLQE